MQKRSQLQHPFLRRDSWSLWSWWLLATVIGGLVGMGIASLLSTVAAQLGSVNSVALLHLVGALQGTVLGLAQWLVLRRYIKRIRSWILTTAIATTVAWLVGLKLLAIFMLMLWDTNFTDSTSLQLLPTVFWLGAWMGTVLGFAQWLVLRPHVHRGFWWIIANSLAWGLALVIALLGNTLAQPGEVSIHAALMEIMTGTTTGIVIGGITGVALVRLLQPRLLRHY